ncbi:MAG: 6-bladed beta-propeller [Breznakibacter sp.]
MRSFIVFLFGLILLIGCDNKQHQDRPIEVDLSNNHFNVGVDEIISRIDTIQLDKNDSCLISNVNDIKVVGEFIFMLDQRQKTIFKFDKTGKFLSKLNRIGRGSDEYISLSSMAIDKENKQMIILDCTLRNIIVYDYDFNEIGRRKYDNNIIVRAVAPVGNGNLLWITPDALLADYKDGIWETNGNHDMVKHHVGFSKNYELMWLNFPVFSSYGDGLSFYDCYNDVMYQVVDGEFKKDFKIDLKQKCPEEIFYLADFDLKTFTGDSFIYSGHVETLRYYLIKYFSSLRGEHYLLMDKKSKDDHRIFGKVIHNNNTIWSGKLFCYNENSIAEIHWDETTLSPSILIYSLK